MSPQNKSSQLAPVPVTPDTPATTPSQVSVPAGPPAIDYTPVETGKDKPFPVASGSSNFTQISQSDANNESLGMHWRQMLGYVLNGSALEPLRPFVDRSNADLKQTVQELSDQNHPWAAGYEKMMYYVQKDATDLLFGLTTPANVALALAAPASALTRVALGTTIYGVNLYNAWMGGSSLLKGRFPNESLADYWNRNVMTSTQTALSLTGLQQTTKNAIRTYSQNKLGMTGDLAGKVADKVAEVSQYTAKEQALTDIVPKIAAESQKDIILRQLPEASNEILNKAAGVVAAEQARVSAPFIEMESKITKLVASVEDMRSIIVNTLSAQGLQDAEINSVMKKITSLPNPSATARMLSPTEEPAAYLAQNMIGQGATMTRVRETLDAMRFGGDQIDAILSVVAPESFGNNVSMADARRIKDQLWRLGDSAPDATIGQAAKAARDVVDGTAYRHAEANGYGPMYDNAKNDYKVFKRELGSGVMEDFISGQNLQEQAVSGRATEYFLPDPSTMSAEAYRLKAASTEAMRKLLNLANVDTSPMDALINANIRAKATGEQVVKDVQSGTAAELKAIYNDTAIVKGKSDEALAGKNTLEIRQAIVDHVVANARDVGIGNPYAFAQILYGTAQLAMSSAFGLLHIGRGVAPETFQNMLKSKSFQDWVIQESMVDNKKIPLIRRVIAGSGPLFTQFAQSGIAAQTFGNVADQLQKEAQTNQVRTLTPQPTTPIRPPTGNIRIAQ